MDGTRSNVLYCVDVPSTSLPPVLVEVQNVFDRSYVHRMQQYCGNIYQRYNLDPIVLTFCIKSICSEYSNDFQDTSKSLSMKLLPCKYYAKSHYVLTPTTIKISSNNNSKNSLEPIAAVQYVLCQQKCSIQSLEYRDDDTVQLLYTIAQHALVNNIQKEDKAVDVLVDVCRETNKQFKRIQDVLASVDDTYAQTAREYANAGMVYTEACLHQYTHSPITNDAAMPAPKSLPEGIIATTGRPTVSILPPLQSPRTKSDMEFVEEFVDEWLKTHNQVSWKECYSRGVEQGYFKSFSTSDSVKAAYYGLKNAKKRKTDAA